MRSKKAQLKTYKKRSVGFDHENGEKREKNYGSMDLYAI